LGFDVKYLENGEDYYVGPNGGYMQKQPWPFAKIFGLVLH